MKDIQRNKYLQLMARIDELEGRIEELQEPGCVTEEIMEPHELEHELKRLQEELAENRNELARISDGCGKPHPL